MKLDNFVKSVECGSKMETENFSIGDEAFILDVISSKMYANPIKAICQEIMSNARDAHRELGNESDPIQVSFPTDLEDNYRVRDFGIGMTPDRITNVYTKYGVSTKRDTNNQTGSFGLGAKVGLSYGDSFTVISIVPETHYQGYENCNVRREYLVYKNEKGIPVISLINESVTKDERGTEIVIPVSKNDKNDFRRHSIDVAEHWDVKPHFVGEEIRYDVSEAIYSGDRWKVYGRSGYEYKTLAIVDGIKYTVDLDKIDLSDKASSAYKNTAVRLFFNTGEILMSATRETLDYSKKNCEIINKLGEEIYETLKKEVDNKIKNAKSFYEANRIFHGDCANWFFKGKDIEWNGHKLLDSNPSICSRYDFNKDTYGVLIYDSQSGYSLNDKPSRSKTYSLNFAMADKHVVCDTTSAKYPSYGRMAAYMEKEGASYISVIKYDENNADAIKLLENKFKWSELKKSLKDLADYEPIKFTSGSSGGSSSPTVKAFKVINGELVPTNIDMKEDKGVYVESCRNDVKFDGNWTDKYSFRNIVDGLSIKNIYAIPTRFISQLGDKWVSFDTVYTKKFDAIKRRYKDQVYSNVDTDVNNQIFEKWQEIYRESGSEDFKVLIKEIIDNQNATKAFNCLPYHVRQKIVDKGTLRNADKKLIENYPLLGFVYMNYLTDGIKAVSAIAEYIKLVDNSKKSA